MAYLLFPLAWRHAVDTRTRATVFAGTTSLDSEFAAAAHRERHFRDAAAGDLCVGIFPGRIGVRATDFSAGLSKRVGHKSPLRNFDLLDGRRSHTRHSLLSQVSRARTARGPT